MLISYNWLRELTNVTLQASELAEQLTMLGLAVDVVHERADDYVLEIDLTSNRPDCLSHLGVAREVAAFTGGAAAAAAAVVAVQLPESDRFGRDGRMSEFAFVEVRESELCSRYAAQVVRGVRVAPSPDWLVKRLAALGSRSINNVADITNYVLLEQGQPLHAFDVAKLGKGKIIVRRALEGESIKTLDGVERELDQEMLVIADAERPVAVAGVMGGADSEISEATTDVLIESAHFNHASVRRTARVLNLHTEASNRFERGVDPEGVLRAQRRAVDLICELAGGVATADVIDIYTQPSERPAAIKFRYRRLKELTGIETTPEQMVEVLGKLGFKIVDQAAEVLGDPARNGREALTVVSPSWRVDVSEEADLVEEIARHVGYNKITSELPIGSLAGEYGAGEERRRQARAALTACGFNEAVNYSFISEKHDDEFELLPEVADGISKVGETEGKERFVTLSNPIIEGVTRMRPTLLAGLLDTLRHNFNHGTRNLRLFEFGRVFAANREPKSLPCEREALAIAITGSAVEEGRVGAERELDFFDLKGAIEVVADALSAAGIEFEVASVKHLREGQAARMMSGDCPVGTLGKLAETIQSAYKFRQAVYVAEIDLTSLLAAETAPVLYTPLPRYPGVVRDVSMIVGRNLKFAEMKKLIFNQGIELCRDVRLVDAYEGKGVPEGSRSLTLRLEYRADERTLRDEEVDEVHRQILVALEADLGVQLRQ